MRRSLAVLGLLAAAVCAAGCPSEPPPPCISSAHKIDESCKPGYVPTFANVYKNTIMGTCGSDNGCHNHVTKAGGLDMSTQDLAYSGLLQPGQRRVVPFDPSCSEMIVRTNSPGEDYQMPPNGDPLSVEERCALIQWVLMGAQQ